MAGETEDEIPETGAVFTFGKSKFADNVPSKFWLKNDVPLKVACGDEHTALITENGKLFMFGSNNWGQLGLGSKTMVNKPTCVKALKSEKVWLAACGRNHTIVYTSRGNVYSTGGNNEGQLGLGDCEERTAFQLVDFFSSHGPIKMLAAGSNTSAALTESGTLFMWGDNTEGQIGLGKESSALTPQEVTVGRPVAWVSCGYYHSAFVTVDGGLYTFGECDSGKLGLATGQLDGHRMPQLVKGITDQVTQVACGGGHTVAVTEEDLYTFGLGQFGQLGQGTFIFEARLPRAVDHFRKGRVRQVMCGENHTAVISDNGLLYTFGDGRHGKLGLGEENFTNQFKPTLCPRFLKYNVQAVTCGGCHMLVLAKPRDKSCQEVTLEENDVTEDYVEKSYTELLGDTLTSTPAILNSSLSARVRRRERERSPEQFGFMFRTLPPLTSGHLNTSAPLPVSSQTIPSSLPPKELTNRKVHNGIHQHRSTGSNKKEKRSAEKGRDEGDSSTVENMMDNESVKDLGDTTDFLNMTHVMKMDPSDKTLTLSPVQKDLRAEEGEGHKDDEEEEEEEKEENNKAEEKEKSEDMEGQSLQGQSQSTAEPLQGPEGVKEETLPDGAQKVAEDSGQPSPLAPTEESSASSTQLQNPTTEEKPKNQPRTNRKLLLFKRLSSSKAKQTEDSAEAPAEGTGMGELPASAKGPSAGLENRDPSETSASGAQPPLRAPSDSGGRGARSTTCTLL
ncbi:X-linked retinitis pigmentosa GTPase regulator isoform X1 [Oncorhynchus mykiss]|uniref:X-linked retinitis pigmentosa GTPase regulator n=1 Tax=Oncorhynchus mykiss TaxID=8022 RepID=A0A8C7U186_ONCMY|nr:X-linked retinitis pigmentosa GTPase regulator isoform X1 [Oncorhynchus mykiss]